MTEHAPPPNTARRASPIVDPGGRGRAATIPAPPTSPRLSTWVHQHHITMPHVSGCSLHVGSALVSPNSGAVLVICALVCLCSSLKKSMAPNSSTPTPTPAPTAAAIHHDLSPPNPLDPLSPEPSKVLFTDVAWGVGGGVSPPEIFSPDPSDELVAGVGVAPSSRL